MNFKVEALRWDEAGLIPAVIQEAGTGTVLMVGYMNQESLTKTLTTGFTWFYSRSRQRLWKKGESSGHVQRVKQLRTDCDQDTLLIQVTQEGPGACHEGYHSCFHYGVTTNENVGGEVVADKQSFNPEAVYGNSSAGVLDEVYQVVRDRQENPKEGSYTPYLFNEGINKILKKVGEEATEVIIAAKDPEDNPLVYETADLLYHLMVLLAERGIHPGQVLDELRSRRGATKPS